MEEQRLRRAAEEAAAQEDNKEGKNLVFVVNLKNIASDNCIN